MCEVREGYKVTELGEIPNDWRIRLFKDVCNRIIVGIASSTTEYYTTADLGVPIIRNQNIKENYLDSNDILYVTKEFDEMNKKKRLKEGDLLTVRTGYPGVTSVVLKEFENAQSFTTLISTPIKEISDSDYLAYYMNSPLGKNQLKNLSAGGAQQNLNVASLSNYEVILPTLPEQQKIASILSTVDEQIDETEQLIVKTKELKKGLMQQLLTKGIGHKEFKQTELGAIPTTWEIKSFEDIMQPKGEGIRRGPFGGALKKEIFVEEGYAVYEQQHVIHNLRDTFRYYITEEKFEELKSFEVLPGDVLISCSGTVGKVLIVPEKSPLGVINQALLRLRPKLKEIDIKFLYYLLTSDFVQKRMLDMTHGSALKNMVSIGELKSILLAIPNTVEEQQKIAQILSTVDEQIEVYEAEKLKYDELKKGLMQKLLTGQIRVKC